MTQIPNKIFGGATAHTGANDFLELWCG